MDEYSELVKSLVKVKVKRKIYLKILLPILPVLLMIVLLFVMLFMVLLVVTDGNLSVNWTNEISELGQSEIPEKFLPIYYAAGEKYQVPWNLLAAIHKVETSFSHDVTVSSAGALGHMQFMPKTWVGWGYPSSTVSNSDLISLVMIARYGGYGVDGNGDGFADPWNIYDAIYSAANYLSANGANLDCSLHKAI